MSVNKKIIIFEGISTSGKTSVIGELECVLRGRKINYKIIDESETLMPIIDNTDKNVAISFLKEIISKYIFESIDLLIFDRLYFTHIFRTHATIADFSEVEDMLLTYKTHLYVMYIDDERIPERIEYSLNVRDRTWRSYVLKKGTRDEIYEYYISQQKRLTELAKNSNIPSTVVNTSEMHFDTIAKNIANTII